MIICYGRVVDNSDNSEFIFVSTSQVRFVVQPLAQKLGGSRLLLSSIWLIFGNGR